MEIFNLPLRIVIAMWLIQRFRWHEAHEVNIHQHLTGQIEFIDKAMRIEQPLRKISIVERWLRSMVSKHRSALKQERDKMDDLNVQSVGFIPKGDDNESKDSK